MYKILSVLVFSFLLVFSFSSAEAADVSGDWEITASTQRGEMTWEVHFDQDGETLAVTMKGRRGEMTGEGTIKGNAIAWTITRETPRGEMTMTWSGEVEGDTMSGEVEFGSFGSSEWEGKRKT